MANALAARGDVFGIVNNVGVARHETFDAVEPGAFAAVMDLNIRPALQLTQALGFRHTHGPSLEDRRGVSHCVRIAGLFEGPLQVLWERPGQVPR